MARCAKQPSPYLKQLNAYFFERKLSLTDTSFQDLDEFLHRSSYFPFKYYDVRFLQKYT